MPGCIECNECTNYGEETACLSPYGLEFSNITTGSVTLNWTGSANVTSYNIEFKLITAGTWNLLTPVIAPTTSATIIGLTPDTVYEFRINAVCTETTCYSLTVKERTLPLEAL